MNAKHVVLSEGRASYREAGVGHAVVIVPGLGLSSRFYEQSYATFERAGLRLIVPDLPGTGDTPGPRTGMDADVVTNFMIDFAHAMHLQRAIYVGHSLGTQSVLQLAIRAPSIVAGFVLVGPTGGDVKWKLLRQAKGLAAESVRVRPGVIGAVAREYIGISPVRYIGTWVKHREEIAESRLSEVACPALLLLGERDAVINAEYMALLQAELRDVTTVALADGSHALPRSQHEEFGEAVISFARRVFG